MCSLISRCHYYLAKYQVFYKRVCRKAVISFERCLNFSLVENNGLAAKNISVNLVANVIEEY